MAFSHNICLADISLFLVTTLDHNFYKKKLFCSCLLLFSRCRFKRYNFCERLPPWRDQNISRNIWNIHGKIFILHQFVFETAPIYWNWKRISEYLSLPLWDLNIYMEKQKLHLDVYDFILWILMINIWLYHKRDDVVRSVKDLT